MNNVVKLVRGLTRPVFTLMLLVAVIALAFRGSAEATAAVITLATTAAGFWYAANTLAKDG